jgi:hypothetical protein
MSGVSIVSCGGSDLDSILSGGQDFIDRLAAFKAAKEAADQARSDLALGKEARAALDEAARILDEAKNTRDAELAKLIAEINAARTDAKNWAAETRASAMASREQAEAHLAEAQRKHDAASKTLADAEQKAADGSDRGPLMRAGFWQPADAIIRSTRLPHDLANDCQRSQRADTAAERRQREMAHTAAPTTLIEPSPDRDRRPDRRRPRSLAAHQPRHRFCELEGHCHRRLDRQAARASRGGLQCSARNEILEGFRGLAR